MRSLSMQSSWPGMGTGTLLTVITLLIKQALRSIFLEQGVHTPLHTHSPAGDAWERGPARGLCMGRTDPELQWKPVSQ